MLVKLDHFPRDRGENKKYLKPPPSVSTIDTFTALVCSGTTFRNIVSWLVNLPPPNVPPSELMTYDQGL